MSVEFIRKVAMVTGRASGIGESVSLKLASEGASVRVVTRNEEGAKRVADQIDSNGGRSLTSLLMARQARLQRLLVASQRALETADSRPVFDRTNPTS